MATSIEIACTQRHATGTSEETRPTSVNAHDDVDSNPEHGRGINLIRSHVVWSIIGKFTNLLVAFLNTSLVARLLRPEEFSDLNRLRTFMMVFSIGLASGLAQCGLRALGHLKPAERVPQTVLPILRRFLVSFITVASIVSLISMLMLYFTQEQVVDTNLGAFQIAVVVLGIVFIGLSELTSELHRGLGAPGKANLIGGTKGAPVSTFLFVSLLLITYCFGKANFAVANGLFVLATGVVSAVGLVSLLRSGCVRPLKSLDPQGIEHDPSRQFTPASGKPDTAQTQPSIWSDVVLLSFAFMISFMILQGDIFMCGRFQNTEESAAYIGARRCIQLISIPLTVVNTMAAGIITPLIASGNRSLLERSLRGFGAAAAIPALVLAIAFLLAPELSLQLILGPGYSAGATSLQILSIGQIVYVITGSCGLVLSLHGCRRTVLIINVVTIVILLLAGPYVAGNYGATGLAILSSALLAVNNLVTWYAARKLTGINTWCSFRWLLTLRHLPRTPRSSVTESN